MDLTVILVEPEYEMNIGYVCRIMANFGRKKLVIVNPGCPVGEKAVKYSKHGVDVLKKAKIVRNFGREIKKYSHIIGTTAVRKRNKRTIRDVVPLGKLNIENFSEGKTALLIGREGIGLVPEEINECDILITIETGGKYPTLNISHALAVILYELSGKKFRSTELVMGPGEKKKIMNEWKRLCIKSKNPKSAEVALRRIISKSKIRKSEAIMIIEVLKQCR
ncbi:RNA methyltransferase [Candidatus Micrarchaeota archaeon]|nr:RNA methyltransferase [Candidatus Micrarchaeota archaeon]